ncbi:hypothetical protein D3C77_492700 [compost metagenome]
MRPVQASRQQWRQGWFLAGSQEQWFFHGLGNPLLRPYLVLGQALEYFVTRHLSTGRMSVWAQAAWRLRQYREHRRFGRRQMLWRLAQVSPTGRGNTLQGAAERCTIEIDLKDLRLGQMPFQLRRAPQLAQFSRQGARVRVQQSSNLHRQGAAARHHPPAAQVLPGSAA